MCPFSKKSYLVAPPKRRVDKTQWRLKWEEVPLASPTRLLDPEEISLVTWDKFNQVSSPHLPLSCAAAPPDRDANPNPNPDPNPNIGPDLNPSPEPNPR